MQRLRGFEPMTFVSVENLLLEAEINTCGVVWLIAVSKKHTHIDAIIAHFRKRNNQTVIMFHIFIVSSPNAVAKLASSGGVPRLCFCLKISDIRYRLITRFVGRDDNNNNGAVGNVKTSPLWKRNAGDSDAAARCFVVSCGGGSAHQRGRRLFTWRSMMFWEDNLLA